MTFQSFIIANARFIGIGGAKMQQQGIELLASMNELNVMGLVEVLPRLKGLLQLRKKLYQTFLKQNIDAFIGIDSPDFCLPLARKLKHHGINTLHCVSPSVWAWRSKRVKSVVQSVDTLMTVLPFEADFYRDFIGPKFQVHFVGHPLQQKMRPYRNLSQNQARQQLGISQINETKMKTLIAMAAGSRMGELKRHLPVLRQVVAAHNDKLWIILLAKPSFKQLFDQAFEGIDSEVVYCQDTALGLRACDVALLKSGTIALQAAMLQTPMIGFYQTHPLSFWLLQKLLTTPWVLLPNILLQKTIVPEFLQHDLPRQLKAAIANWQTYKKQQQEGLAKICRQFDQDFVKQSQFAIKQTLEQSSKQTSKQTQGQNAK